MPVTPLQQNCTLIWCTETMKGAFTDPGGDLDHLLKVAEEAPMQIIVATRSTGPLVELLPEENRLIAEGDDFVW